MPRGDRGQGAELKPPRRSAVASLALLGAGLSGCSGSDRTEPTAEPTKLVVDWGGSEGQPSCSYDPTRRSVEALLTIEGTAPRPEEVTITVTAYADENTSQPVGSASRTLEVEGTVHERIRVTIPVTRKPHIGEDAEVACARTVEN